MTTNMKRRRRRILRRRSGFDGGTDADEPPDEQDHPKALDEHADGKHRDGNQSQVHELA
jgi:hypothetical protein